MAFDSTPWFVGGGAQHSPEVARAMAYAGTRGSEGVAGISDMKVQAQGTPNNTVRIISGGALLLNRYPGGTGQTYSLRCATATDVAITATGSSGGRTDLIIARVLDPQYEGSAPADPTDFQYARPAVIQGVSSGIKSAKELNLAYPAIALAKVMLPASTATVTASMITDLRRVAQPRRERAMVTVFPTANVNMPTGAYSSWPITATQRPTVAVPDWATKVDVIAHVSGVKYTKGTGAADSVAGTRTGFGSSTPSENGIIIQDAEDSGGRYGYTWIGTHTVSAAMRGTDQIINLQAMRSGGTGTWTADYQTCVVIDWEFSEGAQ